MAKDMISLPVIGRAAAVQPATLNDEARTVDIVWTTGATVRRAVWSGWDGVKEYDEELVVSPNAMRLERLQAGAPLLNSHASYDLSNIIGVVVDGSVRIEGGQGLATIKLSDRPEVESIWRDIKAGIIRNFSVGYIVHAYERTQRDGERELWRATDWEPMEISAVAIPADPGAQVRGAQAPAESHPCVLTRQDISAASAAEPKGDTMKDLTTSGGGAEQIAADPAVETRAAPPVQPDPTQVLAAERQRASAITSLCQRHQMMDKAEDWINQGHSVDVVRGLILDAVADASAAEAVAAPAQARDGGAREVQMRDAVTTALMHRHNPGHVQLTNDAREFRGMTLLELAREVLGRRGVNVRGMSKMEVASEAFNMRSAGYHSTSDFPAILANVANKTLRAAYEGTPRTFQAWARRATITDFKPVSRAQLGGAPDLLKVAESGEIKAGTMGDGKETYQLATYARRLGVTRQAIVNDDLDAMTRIPAAFGAAAADLESDLVYQVLLANANMSDGTALFHADHGNLLTASVISEASLAAAYRAFGKQKGIEKRLISVLPRYIIVPPGDRSVEARKQVTATTPSSAADVNAFASRLEVIEEPRLIPASGQDPWFLAADPARIDTVEYAYLDGESGVSVETRTGWEVDGLEIKARLDFAAAALDHRGLSKNPGAAPA